MLHFRPILLNKTRIAKILSLFLALHFGQTCTAQLAVGVEAPSVTGQKVVVRLNMTNSFKVKIESARASLFLLDENGLMVSQGSRWVIGGNKEQLALNPNQVASFNFVFRLSHPLSSTNLTANLNFTQLVLEGGQQIPPAQNVKINKQKSIERNEK